MKDLKESDLESVCKALLSEFQGMLSWKWDSRFETVLAEFGADDKDRIRAVLERYLGITWDSSTIDQAPDIVQMINGNLGGLMPGQLLFTSDPDRDAFILCAWWPWGNGKTVSIRLSPSYKAPYDSGEAEPIHVFRGWFGI